jgi:hypothetical protein
MAKSGTHSLASLFERHYRAAHEADSGQLIDAILLHASMRWSDADLRDYLRQRDARFRLEVDSSQLNFFILDELLDMLPQARFILTIRDCVSWLDSLINHSLSRTPSPAWRRLRDHRFATPRRPHPVEEHALAGRGLYTLDGYLRYWARHNATVIERVPAERLLVVKTHDIAARCADIAGFLGVPPATLEPAVAHSNRARQRHDVLSKLPVCHLALKVQQHCGPLMQRFFPAEYAQLLAGSRAA